MVGGSILCGPRVVSVLEQDAEIQPAADAVSSACECVSACEVQCVTECEHTLTLLHTF